VAEGGCKNSNQLFAILADWKVQLQQFDGEEIEELVKQDYPSPKGPQP